MNTFKAEVNKIILALASVGLLILLIFPASLSAHHFRYGTMSWELVDNDTIRLKMQNGWSANHTFFRINTDYNVWVSGYIGSIKTNLANVDWGDSSTDSDMDFKIISRDNVTPTSYNCSSSGSNICIQSTISEMGEYNSSTGGWTTGLEKDYSDNGTYVVYWTSSARAAVKNVVVH